MREFLYNLRMMGLEYFKKYYGTYRGIVSDNEDPKNLGRLQLIIPQVLGEKPYKYWAWPVGIYAGRNKGSFISLAKEDPVWVRFENGDPRYPIWEYGWWAEEYVPEEATLDNKVFKTDSGNLVEFDDKEKLIRVTSSKGKVIEISDKISLGTKTESSEPALLGTTTKSKIESYMDLVDKLLDSIVALTVPTAMGPSGVPINAAEFSKIKSDLATLKSEMEETLSKIVTLD